MRKQWLRQVPEVLLDEGGDVVRTHVIAELHVCAAVKLLSQLRPGKSGTVSAARHVFRGSSVLQPALEYGPVTHGTATPLSGTDSVTGVYGPAAWRLERERAVLHRGRLDGPSCTTALRQPAPTAPP